MLMLPLTFLRLPVRRWLAALLLLITGTGAAAQEIPPPVPLLWKVTAAPAAEGTATDPAAQNTVYLLGSFHLLRASDYPLAPAVDAALAQADQVVFEIAPQEMDAATGRLVLDMGIRTDDTRLESDLPPETARQLHRWQADNGKWMDQFGIASHLMQVMHPWLVATEVALVESLKAGLDSNWGLDVQLMARARQAGKTTSGLETTGGQIRLLAGMERKEQVQFLQQALEQAAAGSTQIDRLHALWRAGDADGLQRELLADLAREFPRLYQRLNVQRNLAWLPQIETWLHGSPPQTVLVVVGSMHLIGADGLPEHLRARGYVVERIGRDQGRSEHVHPGCVQTVCGPL